VNKRPPPVSIPSQMKPDHTSTPNYPRSILILHSYLRLRLPSDLFPSGFAIKILYAFLISSMRATCLKFTLLDMIILIIFGETYNSGRFSLCSLLHTRTFSLIIPNIFPSTFSQSPSIYILPLVWRFTFTLIQNNR